MNLRGMQRQLSDWLLVASVDIGLFVAPALAGIGLATMVRMRLGTGWQQRGYLFLALAACWGVAVVLQRGLGSDGLSLLMRYAYLWAIPFIFAVYGPDERTLRRFCALLGLLFVLDLGFNVYDVTTGRDLFGRMIDAREGLTMAVRGGGLFAHAFYSGTISMLAFVALMASRRLRWLVPVTIANLAMAGSWRLAIPMLVIPWFYHGWRTRSRRRELVQVVGISVAAVLLIFATSSVSPIENAPVNDANDLRLIAWGLAVPKIAASPLTGVGYPDHNPEAMTAQTVDDALIGESWYFDSAMTFGVPYVLLRLAGLLALFYGRRYSQRTAVEAMLVPLLLTDLVYGDFFEGVLAYAFLWIVIARVPSRRPFPAVIAKPLMPSIWSGSRIHAPAGPLH